MNYYQKYWLELIFIGKNLFPTTKNGLSFQNYAVSERIVAWVIYYSEVLSKYAKNSGGARKKVKFEIYDR